MAPWQPLLDWWFGPEAGAVEVAASRQGLWFGKRDSQDEDARQRFATQVEQALAGGLGDWAGQPEGWLALVLLLDQLPRMLFRDQPRAFAGDTRAQALVRDGIARGLDAQLAPIRRVFIEIVFEHAEDLAVQELAVQRYRPARRRQPAERELFDGFLDYAVRHHAVIARFGRFPIATPSSVDSPARRKPPSSRNPARASDSNGHCAQRCAKLARHPTHHGVIHATAHPCPAVRLRRARRLQQDQPGELFEDQGRHGQGRGRADHRRADRMLGAVGLTSCTWGDQKAYISIQFAGDKVMMYQGQGLK